MGNVVVGNVVVGLGGGGKGGCLCHHGYMPTYSPQVQVESTKFLLGVSGPLFYYSSRGSLIVNVV